jgi:hypothetical protein
MAYCHFYSNISCEERDRAVFDYWPCFCGMFAPKHKWLDAAGEVGQQFRRVFGQTDMET